MGRTDTMDRGNDGAEAERLAALAQHVYQRRAERQRIAEARRGGLIAGTLAGWGSAALFALCQALY